MPSNTEIANFFTPITNQIDGASYVCLNINGSSLSTPNVIQPYVTVNNRGGQPAMFVKIFGLKEFVTANAPSGGSYVLPIASSTVLGGIKVGAGLSIAGDGTLSATGGGVTSVSGLSPLFTVTNPNPSLPRPFWCKYLFQTDLFTFCPFFASPPIIPHIL